MPNVSFKIALPIILVGIFTIVAFMAFEYEKLDANFYIVLVFLSIYVFFFGFAMGQRFASPIKKLLKKASDLSRGDLTTRVYLETKDEFGDLARAFNKIAEDLEQSHQDRETTEKSVDIKVKAKTQALEETINALDQKVKNRTIELQKMIGDLGNFQKQSKAKEAEIADLKNQISALKEGIERNSRKKEKHARIA